MLSCCKAVDFYFIMCFVPFIKLCLHLPFCTYYLLLITKNCTCRFCDFIYAILFLKKDTKRRAMLTPHRPSACSSNEVVQSVNDNSKEKHA